MDDEEAQLVRGRPADVAGLAAAAGLGLLDGALHGDDDVAEVEAGAGRQEERAAAVERASRSGRRRARRPAGVGRVRLRRQERERQDVGRAGRAHVGGVQGGELRVVGEDQPDRGRLRAPRRRAARPAGPAPRAVDGDEPGHARPDLEVDPEGRQVERPGAGGRAGGGGSGAGADGVAARLELDDLVLRVGDPLVVHAQELGHERLADPLEVAERQVALVELAVVEALVDDPADHRPDRRLVVAATASGPTPRRRRRASGSRPPSTGAAARCGGSVARRARPRPPGRPPSRGRRTGRPPARAPSPRSRRCGSFRGAAG